MQRACKPRRPKRTKPPRSFPPFRGKEGIFMGNSQNPVTIEEVYEQYFSVIYNYVYYKLLNRENSEDIVSQVFLKVLKNLHLFDPEKASMKTWLFRITDHALIDFYRKQKPGGSFDDEEAGFENILSVDFDEEYDRIVNPKRRMLLEALKTLPERDRMFIYYKYFLNITNREIAQRLMMNENTVSAVMARARNKLKLILQDQI
ncbi:MAG: sigma-70 family RNA polymerase sigma factor [Clostridiales bacterium]|nr:sigma-70 family RNA polymerase sigma factor [Clostridiales bacterium]